MNSNQNLENELEFISSEMKFSTQENNSKKPLIAAYFRMFHRTKYEALAKIKNLNESELVNYKCIDLSKSEVDDNFLYFLSKYRYCCCPDAKLQDLIGNFASHINDDPLAFFYELVQNADDCKYAEGVTPSFEVELNDKIIKLHHNEIGMTPSDIFSLCSAGESNKDADAIGEKGIGFKTVFAKCDRVDVVSGGYSFSLIDYGFHIDEFEPEDDYGSGTTMILHIGHDVKVSAEDLYNKLRENYGIDGDKNAMFCKCPVMYTKKLRSITVSCGEDKFSVSSKKDYDEENGTVSITVCVDNGKESKKEIKCFGIYKDVEMTEDAFESRYPDMSAKDCSKQRIEIIAALDDEVIEGNMYSYLPCSQKIKASFCVQLPVKLNLNRTRMFFIGDSDTSDTNDGNAVDAENPQTIEWNKQIVNEFISCIPDFYSILRTKVEINKYYSYIPNLGGSGELFDPAEGKNYMNTYCNQEEKLDEKLMSIPYFKVIGSDEYCSAGEAVLFDELICNKLNVAQKWAEALGLNKTPVEYGEGVLEYGKRVGLTKFGYGEYEKDDLTERFNRLISDNGKQDEVLDEIYVQKAEYDILNCINKDELCLYCASVPNGVEYLNKKGIWFINDNLKSRKDCFFHFTSKDYSGKGIELVDVADIAGVLKALNNKIESLTETNLGVLCDFLKGNGIEACSDFIKNESKASEYFALLVRKLSSSNIDNEWKELRALAEKRLGFDTEYFKSKTAPITSFDKCESELNKLKNAVINHIKYSMDNSKNEATNENVPAYELLQNADDSKRRNREADDEIGKDFEINKEDDKTIVLRYSEAGFSLWDFFCVVSKGSSGNKDTAVNTGKFGSGFKSIYTVCDKVKISGGDVDCVLDTTDYTCFNDITGDMKNRLKSFPVPQFSKRETKEPNITEIHLYFADEGKADDFYEKLVAPENYVFLKDIEYPVKEEYPFPRDNSEKGFYYCPETNEGEKPLYELYFPLPYNSKNTYPLYCGLPMKDTDKLPFMLNIPRIFPAEDRNSISTNDANRKCNSEYLQDVLDGIKDGFEAFAKAHPDAAYKFMPSDGIVITYNGEDISMGDLDDYCIYPYKIQGEIKGCASINDIEDFDTTIKVFEETFYKCLALDGVGEKLLNENLQYIGWDIKRLIKAEANYHTILDTIYGKKEQPPLDEVDFINKCLPLVREELYADDVKKLVDIIKSKGLSTLAKFNGEDNAAKYFSQGLVAFNTIRGCSVYKGGAYYYVGKVDEDLIKIYVDKSGMKRVITDTNLNRDNVEQIDDLWEVFDDEAEAKDFFKSEEETEIIKLALELNEVNSVQDDVVKWLCEVFEEENGEKYCELLEFVVLKGEINDFVDFLKNKENISPYYDLLKSLLSDKDSEKDCISSLIGLIPKGGDEYLDWLKNTIQNIEWDDGSVKKAKRALAEQLQNNLNNSDVYFDLLYSLTRINTSIFCSTIDILIDLSNSKKIYADRSIVLLENENYVFYESNYQNSFINLYKKYSDVRFYNLFEKGLGSDKAEPNSATIAALVELIKDSPEKRFYEAFTTAVVKCVDTSLTIDGCILTTTIGFDAWIKAKEQRSDIDFQFEFDDESIKEMVRLSKDKNKDWYNSYISAGGDKQNEYSIFEGDEGTKVYFLELEKCPKGVEAVYLFEQGLNDEGIVVVPCNRNNLVIALKWFLNDWCKIRFMSCDKFVTMTSEHRDDTFSGDEQWKSGKLSKKLQNNAKALANDLLKGDIKSVLINTFRVDGYEFSGYGAKKICPICKGTVFAEASALHLKWVFESGKQIPLLMCGNCCEFVEKYTYSVEFKNNRNLLSPNELTLQFSLEGDKKSVNIEMPFLHRMMLASILSENDEQNTVDEE